MREFKTAMEIDAMKLSIELMKILDKNGHDERGIKEIRRAIREAWLNGYIYRMKERKS